MTDSGRPPLVAHIIQRLAVGGLENGLVNLINHMPEDRYRHVIVCLADATDYSRRIARKNVSVIALHQGQGQDFATHWRLLKLLQHLRPAIVHTRNLAALEFQVIAALAGVRGRVHGEHGRDMHDLDGENRKYNILRKTIRPFVQHYTAVSADLKQWLVDKIGVRPDRVTQIYNGVDIKKFRPRERSYYRFGPDGFLSANSFVVGTVGRMEPVKDQITLVRAFVHLVRTSSEARKRLRLVVIGDGRLRSPAIELLRSAEVDSLAWLPGERDDVAELMRSMDLFVLPSLREGISNTILEAMATGLPVVATRIGGNPELVDEGNTGMLVPNADAVSMAVAIGSYLENAEKGSAHGKAGRARVESQFTMNNMVAGYLTTYDSLLGRKSVTKAFALSQTRQGPFQNVPMQRIVENAKLLTRTYATRALMSSGGMRLLVDVANSHELHRQKYSGRVMFPFVKKTASRTVHILLYHRVNDDNDAFFSGVGTAAFRRQMEYIAENYHVCELGEAIDRMTNDDVPDRAIVITFDDGYRDNFTNAYPILRQLGIPATIFLATGAIGSGTVLWHDLVFSAFRTTRLRFIKDFPDVGSVYSLQNTREKLSAQHHILEHLWSLPDDDRAAAVDRLRRGLAACNPREKHLMLSWDEVRAMYQNGISFGSHTCTHPILSKASADRVRREIVDSKLAIEINLRCKVQTFAYPVGRSQDFDDRTKSLLKEAGFRCAVTTRFGVNLPNQDLFELRRATPWETDLPSFASKLAWYRFAARI